MAYFLCYPGTYHSKWKLIDLLWPEMEEKQGSSSLFNTLYLLKKIFREHDFGMEIKRLNNGYMLEPGEFAYDVQAFNEMKNHSLEADLEEERAEFLCTLYRGPLLSSKPYLWKVALEEAYHIQYTALTRWLVKRKIGSRRLDQAEEQLELYLSLYPQQEEMTALLLGIYEQRGKKEKMKQRYVRFAQAYRREYSEEAPNLLDTEKES